MPGMVKALRGIDKLVEAAAALCLAVSALMICVNVFRRYVVLGWLRELAEQWQWLLPVFAFVDGFFAPIGAVADEVPGLLLVWISFLGAYLVQRRDGHIRFGMLVDALPVRVRTGIGMAVDLALLAFFVLVFVQSLRMIWIDGATEIETADIMQGWFMTVIPISSALLMVAIAAALLGRRGGREK